jgi:hypothetical protein
MIKGIKDWVYKRLSKANLPDPMKGGTYKLRTVTDLIEDQYHEPYKGLRPVK